MVNHTLLRPLKLRAEICLLLTGNLYFIVFCFLPGNWLVLGFSAADFEKKVILFQRRHQRRLLRSSTRGNGDAASG